jgi:hypothetical protein
MPPDPAALLVVRLAEVAIADFEARMHEVILSYRIGEPVDLHGDVFKIVGFQTEGMSGYWLQSPGMRRLFLPVDLERALRPIVQ